jgi:hypothetical protein
MFPLVSPREPEFLQCRPGAGVLAGTLVKRTALTRWSPMSKPMTLPVESFRKITSPKPIQIMFLAFQMMPPSDWGKGSAGFPPPMRKVSLPSEMLYDGVASVFAEL